MFVLGLIIGILVGYIGVIVTLSLCNAASRYDNDNIMEYKEEQD